MYAPGDPCQQPPGSPPVRVPPQAWPGPPAMAAPPYPVGAPAATPGAAGRQDGRIPVGCRPPLYEPAPEGVASHPLIAVAGYPLSCAEDRQLRSWKLGILPLLYALFVFLFLLLGLQEAALSLLSGGGDLLSWTLAVGGPALAAFGGLLLWNAAFRREERRRTCRMQVSGCGRLLEFYDDRVVETGERERTELFYARVTSFWESPAFLLLEGEGVSVCVRASELTDYDARLIEALLYRRIPGGRRRFRGVLQPSARQPLPLPAFTGRSAPPLEFTLEGTCLRRGKTGRTLAASLLFVLPLVLPAGALLAGRFSLPLPRAIAVAALCIACSLPPLLLIALTAGGPRRGRTPGRRIGLVFTPDGLTLRLPDGDRFVPGPWLRAGRARKYLKLDTPYGAFRIAWRSVPDRALLEALLR